MLDLLMSIHVAAVALMLCASALLPATARAQGEAPQRIFYSGHSLLDTPLPQDVAAIAASVAAPLQWNRQSIDGSSIRERTWGAGAWQGFRTGNNREGSGMDVLAEWRAPSTVSAGAYDALIITEQHTLVGNLVWNDSVRYLRFAHERFISANARAVTWLYASWLDIDNPDDPRRWIAYERAAAPMWVCMATRINTSLAAEGRADRIKVLPAGALLAALVERATQGAGLPGFGAPTPRATLELLLRDRVHLTALGSYYLSLVVAASLLERPVVGAAVPAGLDDAAARALQAQAWPLVQQERAGREVLSLADCRERLASRFVHLYSSYLRDAVLRPTMGSARAHALALKWRAQWRWALRVNAPRHPLRFEAATDATFWLPQP